MNCEICGGNVKAIGKTTMSYKNLDKLEIERLKTENEKLKAVIYKRKGKSEIRYENQYSEWAKSQMEIIKEKYPQAHWWWEDQYCSEYDLECDENNNYVFVNAIIEVEKQLKERKL